MKSIWKIAFIAGILLTAAPSFAQLYIGLGVKVGPPPARREVVPTRPPHPGWIWIAGHYDWRPRPHRYVWVRGSWARPPRPHAVWVAGHWEQRHGEWVFFEGRWDDEHHRDEEHHIDH